MVNLTVSHDKGEGPLTVYVWQLNAAKKVLVKSFSLAAAAESVSTGNFYLAGDGDDTDNARPYYIQVVAPSANAGYGSKYSVAASIDNFFAEEFDANGDNNSRTAADSGLQITIGDNGVSNLVSDWVGIYDKIDYWKVDGIGVGSYNISLDNINGNQISVSLGYFNAANGQFVALYTRNGAVNAEEMTLAMTVNANNVSIAEKNGGFYLRVNSNGNGNSDYNLVIKDYATVAGSSAADEQGGTLEALTVGDSVAGWVGMGYQKDIRGINNVNIADAGYYDLNIGNVENPVQVILYRVYKGVKYAIKSLVVSAGSGVIKNILIPGDNSDYLIEVNALYAASDRNTGYTLTLNRVEDVNTQIDVSAIAQGHVEDVDLAGEISLSDGKQVFYRSISGAYDISFSGQVKGSAVMNVYEMLSNGTQRLVRQFVLNNNVSEVNSGTLFFDNAATAYGTGIYKFEIVPGSGAQGSVNIEYSGYDVTDYIAHKDDYIEYSTVDWVGRGDAEDVKTGVTVKNDGIYSFNFSGINGNNMVFQIFDESTNRVVGSFTPAAGATEATYSCALKANVNYKLVVKSRDGGVNCFSEYTMSEPVFHGSDSDNNTEKGDCSVLNEATTVTDWVGNGDTVDYIKLELDDDTAAGKYDISFADLQNNAYVVLYEISNGRKIAVAGGAKYVKATDNVLSGIRLVQGKNYYLSVSAISGNGTADTSYSVSLSEARDYTGLTASTIKADDASFWTNGVYNWVGFCNTSDVYKLGELQGVINITLSLGNAKDSYVDETGNLSVALWRCNSKGDRIERVGIYSVTTLNSSIASGDICINSGDTNPYKYEIEVIGNGVNSDYTLQVNNRVLQEEKIANNTRDTALEISCNETVNGVVWNYKGQGDKFDYYKFNVAGNGGSYTINLDNANSNVRVWLYNSKGAAMQVKNVAQATGEAYISVNLTAGEYYVAVESYTNSTASDYELTVNKNPVNNNDDTWQKVAANVDARLYEAENSNIIGDWVGFGDAVDVFKVMTGDNGQLVFAGNNDDTEEALSKREITLSLVDANGRAVSLSFNSTDGKYTTATTLMADSEYYLAVNSTQPNTKNTAYSIAIAKK